MRSKLGTALAAVALVVTVAGCGGGDDGSSAEGSASGGSSESAEASESTEAEPEADTGGQPSVDEIAEQLEAAGTEGTPEEFRCLAQALTDAGLTGDQIVGILNEDPSVASDPDVLAAFDEAGPEVGKCYGVGG